MGTTAGTSHAQRKNEKEKALEHIIAEQHRNYDYLLKIYERAGTKENTLLAAAFGVVAYLYYAAPGDTIAERLFIPPQNYGQVTYIMAATLFIYCLARLILNVFGDNPWHTAYETQKTNYTYQNLATLSYIKKRYDDCQPLNLKTYKKRKKDLTFCFYGILLSAIVLIVIKTLQ